MAEAHQAHDVLADDLVVLCAFGDLAESLTVAVVVKLEKLILLVILETDQGALHKGKVHQVDAVDVAIVYLQGERLQGEVEVDLLAGGAGVADENELVKEVLYELHLFFRDVLQRRVILILHHSLATLPVFTELLIFPFLVCHHDVLHEE